VVFFLVLLAAEPDIEPAVEPVEPVAVPVLWANAGVSARRPARAAMVMRWVFLLILSPFLKR
jgi:hypothetical protein